MFFVCFQLAAPLADNDNASDSFYCIKDSPLLNNLFGQYVEESIYVKKSHDCSKFQMACLKCFQQAHLEANSSTNLIWRERRENCNRRIKCYNTPGCLGYYSPPCYPDDHQEVPENGTCVKEYELNLHYLRSIQRTKGMLQSDQSESVQTQGDIRMKAVQVSRPFLYSTSNWRSAGCDLDIGNFMNEDEVLYGATLSPALRLSQSKEKPQPFAYVIANDRNNKLGIKILLNGV
ncbi:unnamed protein product [Hydatigera taeniaeformis]|uniref:MANSC domain-containing protein n=1 Tax=Hydatigena taeniaeformis TaxID=6205 RepID=A0A0R3WLU9_HYDTA|nr:unnamed protein product [Hydatigera taeniaeformis]